MRPTIPLPGGGHLPLIGFGTYKLTGTEGYDAVRAALDVGYRHIDTATMYGNELEVGRAVRDSGVDRDDVFITTKLWPDDVDRARESIAASLHALGMDHVDLWLIHWPPGGRASPAAWRDLLAARDDALARDIGVSNHSIEQLDELHAATGVMPAVNQIQWGPTRFDPTLLAAHRDRGVALEGWAPLRGTDRGTAALTGAAANHDVTVEQVIIRWHLQHGVVVIPKSARPARIAVNADVFGFELTDDEMVRIDALGRG